tara:strand:+ start:113 stop:439 length:327 start_codon:yes stop_codon:yes gene_type:complete
MTWEDTLKIYDAIVEDCKGFERKGKNMIYTSSNGYMFTLLNKEAQIGIRLPKDIAAKFKTDFNSDDYYSHGAKMRDYVIVPDAMCNDKKLLVSYFEKSFAYVNSLPPK